MNLELTHTELETLERTLNRQIDATQRELASTSSFAMQRDLARDIDELQHLRDYLKRAARPDTRATPS